MSRASFSHLVLALTVVGLSAPNAIAASPVWPVALAPVALKAEKFTVCSVTINSSNERETFRRRLNPDEFQFVELIPEGKPVTDANDWFHQACKSNVQCDLLLISGHFGGTFFGKSGYTLPFELMERHSCSQDCSGILEKPAEVFLFGCNTLATKEKDGRTQEQYLQLLVADGRPRWEAEWMAEFRYGPVGESNKERMRKIFSRVRHLYGFHSVGPTGKQIEQFLDQYLKSRPDYADYLAKDAIAALSRDLENTNRELAQSLSRFKFSQCSGLTPNDPEYPFKEKACAMLDERRSLTERLQNGISLMEDARFLAFAPVFASFFRDHPVTGFSTEQKILLEQMKDKTKPRAALLDTLSKLKTPVLKTEMAQLAFALNWLSREQYLAQLKVIKNLLKPPYHRESLDAVCSLRIPATDVPLTNQDLAPGFFASEATISTLGCLRPQDPGIRSSLFVASGSSNLKVRQASLRAIERIAEIQNRYAWPAAHVAMLNSYRNDRDPEVRAAASRILALIQSRTLAFDLFFPAK